MHAHLFAIFLVRLSFLTLSAEDNNQLISTQEFVDRLAWNLALCDLNARLSVLRTSEQIVLAISNISTHIKHVHLNRLSSTHQADLCGWYALSLDRLESIEQCSQKTLLNVVKRIIHQNTVLSICLDIPFWKRFLDAFYASRRAYADRFFCHLLGLMQSEGSGVSPTFQIFHRILLASLAATTFTKHKC